MKLIAVLALVLATGCGGAAPEGAAQGPSPSPSPGGAPDRLGSVSSMEGSASAGRALFAQRCGTCHGGGGKGGFGPNLTGVDETLLVTALIQGRRGGMPSFGTLTDQQLADVTAFVMQIE